MAGDKVLVLGATGPAGICVLRELLHRKVPTVAFVRNPTKIPADLAGNILLEVIKGDLSKCDDLSRAIAKSRAIISLLGPGSEHQPRNTFADYYQMIFSLMKENGVHRILALATTAIYRPEDQTSVARALTARLIRLIANSGYHNILAIREYFQTVHDHSLEWTVYRLGMLSGTSDEAIWSVDRNLYDAYAGPVGATGFTSGVNRSVLAKWLVDTALDKVAKWSHQMPAICKPGK